MNDIPNLEVEINSISDIRVKALTRAVFQKVPNYFFTLPASSSGKYHPPKERGPYGLVYHTKEVFRMGVIIQDAYTDVNLDEAKAAILLHDVGRYGLGKAHAPHTLTKHPDVAADLVLTVADEIGMNGSLAAERIASAVRRHMGRWGREKPKTNLDWTVHLADNIASKNW